MRKVLGLLQPFYMITVDISKTKSMLSFVIPPVRALYNYLRTSNTDDVGIQTMKNDLKISIEKLFFNEASGLVNVFENKLFVTTTASDPHYEISVFSLRKAIFRSRKCF